MPSRGLFSLAGRLVRGLRFGRRPSFRRDAPGRRREGIRRIPVVFRPNIIR